MKFSKFCEISDSINTMIVFCCIYVAQYGFANAEYTDRKKGSESKDVEMYKNCGNSDSTSKLCFGETRQCIKDKSCTLLATITDTESRFKISILDKCQRNINDSIFYATSAATFDDKGGLDCSKKLAITDIKVFIFWKKYLCRGGKDAQFITESGVTKSQYIAQCETKANENYGKMMNTLDQYDVFSDVDLNSYLNNFVRFATVKGGQWKEANRPFRFPKSMTYVTIDQVFITSIEIDHNDASSFYLGLISIFLTVFLHGVLNSFLFVENA